MIAGSHTMALLEKLEPGNVYLVKLCASNKVGDGPFSDTVELVLKHGSVHRSKNPRHSDTIPDPAGQQPRNTEPSSVMDASHFRAFRYRGSLMNPNDKAAAVLESVIKAFKEWLIHRMITLSLICIWTVCLSKTYNQLCVSMCFVLQCFRMICTT